MLAPGQIALTQDRPGQVEGLSEAERRAIRQACDAGHAILLLHGSIHAMEALHVLLNDGGPSARIQAAVTWDNETSTTVPPLVINASIMGNQRTFTKYLYCTVGSTVGDCVSILQMTNPPGEICLD